MSEINRTKHIWIPETIIESAAGRQSVPLRTKLFDQGKIFITEEITEELAHQFMMQLLHCKEQEKAVDLIISSPGGSVSAGLQMYDMMQGYAYEIRTIATGTVASMAALLFTSAKKGNRLILPHAKLMIHEVLVQSLPGGSATSVKEFSDTLNKSKEAMNELLAKHTGKDMETINQDTSYDHYFTAEEAIKYGLADKIASQL